MVNLNEAINCNEVGGSEKVDSEIFNITEKKCKRMNNHWVEICPIQVALVYKFVEYRLKVETISSLMVLSWNMYLMACMTVHNYLCIRYVFRKTEMYIILLYMIICASMKLLVALYFSNTDSWNQMLKGILLLKFQ